MNKDLKSLSLKLHISFINKDLIYNAFIHRSYLNENKISYPSNERLEFLGDSILEFLVSRFLYNKFPNFTEGELTSLRSSLVNTKTLAKISKKLELGKYIYLSKGEEEGGGRNNQSILADTFEALLGAVYLDQDLKEVDKILNAFLYPLIDKIILDKSYKDSKSSFQELIQEEIKTSPIYKVINEAGPDHLKHFTVGVFVSNNLWGTGKGKSKQEAEQMAAKDALEKWKKK